MKILWFGLWIACSASICAWADGFEGTGKPQQATITNWPSYSNVGGTVNVGNLPSVQVISGTVAVSNPPAVQVITGTVSVSNLTASVSVTNFPSTQTVSGTVTESWVAAVATITTSVNVGTTTAVVIVSSNTARKGLFLYNNSANSAYIAYDSTVNSNTHMTFLIPTFTTWTMPYPLYQGAIAAIRNAGSGTVLVTELK